MPEQPDNRPERIGELIEENAALREALRPFSGAVFNDNGDMTVDYTAVSYDDFVRAYFADRRPRTTLEATDGK